MFMSCPGRVQQVILGRHCRMLESVSGVAELGQFAISTAVKG